jgi:putative spermidine/putrescine transport system substrate-binding protein
MSFSPKRRWFGAATTAAVLTLAGCGSTAGGSGSTLTFVSFGGDYQKAQSAAMVKPYQEANKGIKLIEDQPTDYAKIKTMVESKIVSADVVDADPFFPIGNCDKYAEKLDYSVIDTTKMPKAFVSDCAVPSMTYAYVMMYNTEKYGDNPPKSWADFFDTTKFPGTRAIENAYIGGGLEEALLADGVAADKLYPLDYDRAFKKLDTIKKDLKFWKTGAEAQQMMENKQADIVVAWSGRAYNAVKNGAPYAPQWNQHFATYDVFMVPKGTKNKEAAMKFIAYATGPVAQASLTEHIPYAPINSDAKPNVDAETAKFLPSQPEIAAQGIPIDHKWYAENQADASAKWTKWTTG